MWNKNTGYIQRSDKRNKNRWKYTKNVQNVKSVGKEYDNVGILTEMILYQSHTEKNHSPFRSLFFRFV